MKWPMFIFFVLALTALPLARADVEYQIRSLLGGPEEDIQKKAADYFSLPGLNSRESKTIYEALAKKFPVGMKKEDLLRELRKLRRQHLCDTELRVNDSFTKDAVNTPGSVEFDVKSYTSLFIIDEGRVTELEDEVRIRAITFVFRLSEKDEIEGYGCRTYSVPL